MYGNTIGRTEQVFGGGKRIWHDIFHSYPVGGTVSNISNFPAGTVIPAGSPAIYSLGSVEIVSIPESFDASKNYSSGAKVIKGGVLYKATSSVTAGAWDSSKWAALAAGDTTFDKVAQVNGLTHNDIYVENGAIAATAGVVYAGVVYESRLNGELPDLVWANLSQIKRIKEA